jgi:predicted trehalose synthase
LQEIQGLNDEGVFINSLKAWALERALYELFYELNYGTGYVYVPLEYLLREGQLL